jgi:hypothetical protein
MQRGGHIVSSTADGDFQTKYGTIHCRFPGPKKKYKNVDVYHQTADRIVQLQTPALRAFKAAEKRLNEGVKRRRIIKITGVGYRSYDLQKQLWLTDKNRYASPDTSMHVEADAVDIDTGQRFRFKTVKQTQALIRKALEAEGWHYAVSGEPWHASFKVAG